MILALLLLAQAAPEISAIVDASAGWQRRAPQFPSTDDPDLHGDDRHALGFTAQQIEIAANAVAGSYFRGEVVLTIPNLGAIGVEEAFAATTSLPWGLQLKAGAFRSAFGRQNGQHLHEQDFTRRPLINAAFLGPGGLRGPGLQIGWVFSRIALHAEAFSLSESAAVPVRSFGSGGPRRPTLAAEAKLSLPVGEAGLSFAEGESPGMSIGPGSSVGAGRQVRLIGADLLLKWIPAGLALQAEAIVRHFAEGDGLGDAWDGGAYAQVTAQFARRWLLGLRGELAGLPSSPVTARTARVSLSVTFAAGELARVRAHADLEKGNISFRDESIPAGVLLPAVQPSWAPAAMLQLEVGLGVNSSHPF